MEAGKQKKSDVTRVFWPSHCSDSSNGLLVGWNVHSFTACVATVTDGIELTLLKHALDVLALSSRYSHLFDECGGPPTLLGEYRGSDPPPKNSKAIQTMRQTANFWLTLDRQHGQPQLCEIHCCGFRYSVFSVTAQFVIYRQPRSSSYFSTIPFSPDLRRPAVSFHRVSDFEKALMQINEAALVEHVLREVTDMLRRGTKPSLLLREAGTRGLAPRREQGPSSALASPDSDGWQAVGSSDDSEGTEPGDGEEATAEAHRGEWQAAAAEEEEGWGLGRLAGLPVEVVHGVIVQVVMIAMVLIHLGVLVVDAVLELPLGRLGRVLVAVSGGGGEIQIRELEGVRLMHVSATARQVKLRLSQMLSSPMISPSAWMLLQKKTSNAQTRAVTVSFNTTVCMIGIDLLLGVVSASYVLTHSRAVLESVHGVAGWHGLALQQAVRWLMGIPAGLKLNDNLDYCLGNLCIIGVQCYLVIYHWCVPAIPWVILGVAVSGVLGATIMLCLVSDLLSLATMHISIFYALASKWHGVQTRVLSSLWRLFRGKKKNVLRGRIDACDFSLDQLLLGSILFTVLVFLFPTSFVYYLLFYLLKHAVGTVQTVIRLTVSTLNHFPVFSLLLCIYDPTHLPGGAHLVLLPVPGSKSLSSPGSQPLQEGAAAADGREGDEGLRHSVSLPNLTLGPARMGSLVSEAAAASHAAQQWRLGPAKPSPLRANERKKASLIGRSAYFQLCTRPLPVSALFKVHKERFVAVLSQHSPGQILRSLLLAQQPPPITFSDSPTLSAISVLELWLFMKALLFAPQHEV